MLKRYYINCLTASESLITQENPEGNWVRAGDVKALEEAAKAALKDLSPLIFGPHTGHTGYESIEKLRAVLEGTKNTRYTCPKCGEHALRNHKYMDVLNAGDWYFTVTLEVCLACGHLKKYEVE